MLGVRAYVSLLISAYRFELVHLVLGEPDSGDTAHAQAEAQEEKRDEDERDRPMAHVRHIITGGGGRDLSPGAIYFNRA